jgi:hypothetical protein
MRETCAGSVRGTGDTAAGKRTPPAARASRAGVAFWPATQPKASGRRVSTLISRMSGRGGLAAGPADAAQATAATRIATDAVRSTEPF